jgi:hypothetical protein
MQLESNWLGNEKDWFEREVLDGKGLKQYCGSASIWCWIGSEYDFHFYADPDLDPNLDPDWHQNNADPHAYPTPSFAHVGKLGKILLLLFTVMSVYNVFLFLSLWLTDNSGPRSTRKLLEFLLKERRKNYLFFVSGPINSFTEFLLTHMHQIFII